MSQHCTQWPPRQRPRGRALCANQAWRHGLPLAPPAVGDGAAPGSQVPGTRPTAPTLRPSGTRGLGQGYHVNG